MWQEYDLSDNSEALVYEWAQLTAGLLWCLQTLLLWEIWNKIQLEQWREINSYLLFQGLQETDIWQITVLCFNILIWLHNVTFNKELWAVKMQESLLFHFISYWKSGDGAEGRPDIDQTLTRRLKNHCLKVDWNNLEPNTVSVPAWSRWPWPLTFDLYAKGSSKAATNPLEYF